MRLCVCVFVCVFISRVDLNENVLSRLKRDFICSPFRSSSVVSFHNGKEEGWEDSSLTPLATWDGRTDRVDKQVSYSSLTALGFSLLRQCVCSLELSQ